MSQEKVEIVRTTFDAICRRDYQRARDGFHDDAVWHNTAAFSGPNICVGLQAIAGFWESLVDSFEGETNVERVIEGEDAVLVAAHTVGRGRSSGVPLDVRWSLAFRVRGGKVSRVDVYGDLAKALEAVGSGGVGGRGPAAGGWLEWRSPWANYRADVYGDINPGGRVMLLICDFERRGGHAGRRGEQRRRVDCPRREGSPIDFYVDRNEVVKAVDPGVAGLYSPTPSPRTRKRRQTRGIRQPRKPFQGVFL